MTDRNFQKERKLQQDWSYLRPMGPHTGENSAKPNIEEMAPADVEALIEAGDAMAEYIDNL